ncbi:MAG: hypothetical protein ACP5MH_10900 [Thermoproteus sp.]
MPHKVVRLVGPPGCIAAFLYTSKKPLAFHGPVSHLAGRFVVAEAPEGYSTFGDPPPLALDYCLPGAGRYASELEPPYRLEDLLEVMPSGLREKAQDSACIRRAFYLSRIDPSPLRRSLVYAADPLLFLTLSRYMPLYTVENLPVKTREKRVECRSGADAPPPAADTVILRVYTPEEYINYLYVSGLAQLFLLRFIRRGWLRLLWRVLRQL